MTLYPTGPQLGRRAQAREQRRRQRRRLLVAGATALVVLVALVAVVLVQRHGGKDKGTGAQERTQRTLLVQVKGANGEAVASALLAHDPAGSNGAVVLVPPQVLATVPGTGSLPFGKALLRGVAGARNALSDLMGVTIDGSWLLDRPTFQRLVDAAGGVDVDVDAVVLSGRTVVLQPGQQHLDGVHAYAYATYLAPGEQEQSRLARLQAVLDGLLTALPDQPEGVVGALGSGSRSTLPRADLAALLAGLKKDDAADQLQYRSLPVIKVDAGSDEVRFRIDAPANEQLVDDLLAQSVPPGARDSGNRVLVLNGVGTPGLGEKVRAKLVPAGFVFVGSRNAPSFGYATTQVLVKDATTEGSALGARVAAALGVPTSSVAASDQIGTIADVVVIVGRDFKAS